ncbi:extracellular solute-binding protein [Nakamurella lactea]|uniref:extracellular solute-binding protein n=1 Tax=Nakamurella lactea TaxID=459515 RepID=UPI0004237FD7|nr:extracellular solute-binding protein [Nakamurella lactea]
MRTPHRLRAVTAALSVAALLTAGACSSDSGTAGTSTPSAAGASPAAAQSSAGDPTSEESSTAAADPTTSAGDSSAAPPATSAAAPVKDVTLTVWMQGDTLKDIDITALNKEFQAAHPGVTVDLQEQTWGEYTTKVTTGLADTSGGAPDVLELGNTQVAQFAGAGALLELSADDFDNSKTWLQGLKESATYDDKLVAVPYYAGVRVGIYRTDLAEQAGIKTPFNSLDELESAGAKLLAAHGDDGSYSGLYFPSQYWYEGISFIWDAGGEIAVQQSDGSWKGALDSPESKAGLARLKKLVDATSRGGEGQNEADDALVMAQEQAAMFIDASWKPGVVTAKEDGNPKLEGKVGIFVVPGSKPGTVMPQFLGGSDIAINAKTPNADLAKAYTKLLTGQKYQQVLAGKGYIANSTSFKPKAGDATAAIVVKAASTGRFVPNSKNWTKVEDGQVLQNMFDAVLTGSKSIDDATAEASADVTKLLNG